MSIDMEAEYEFDPQSADSIELGLKFAQKTVEIARTNHTLASYGVALKALAEEYADEPITLLRGIIAAGNLLALLLDDVSNMAYTNGADELAAEAAEPVGAQ